MVVVVRKEDGDEPTTLVVALGATGVVVVFVEGETVVIWSWRSYTK